MADTSKAESILSREQAALLSGDFAAYSGYFNRFTNQHFPQINLIMVDKQDPNLLSRVRDGVMGVFERPETQRRLGDLNYTDALPMFNAYADSLAERLSWTKTQHENKGAETSQLRITGFYQINYPRPEIVSAGGQVSPIVVDGGHCTSCKPKLNLRSCDGLLPEATDARDQLQRIATGFHEVGHALTFHERSLPGIVFSQLASDKHFTNRIESVADSFMTMMMVREFGAFGVDFIKLSHRGAGTDADHVTERSMAATRDWISDNEDKLYSLTPAELFKIAHQIGNKHALTPAEHKQADAYLAKYNKDEHFTSEAITARLDAYERQKANKGPLPDGYSAMAHELDRDYLAFQATLKPTIKAMTDRIDLVMQCAAPTYIDTSKLVAPEDKLTPEQRREQGLMLPPARTAPKL